MGFYQKHLFFCINERPDGRKACADGNAVAMRDYAKQRLKELNLWGPGRMRVSQSGCLGRCAKGPSMVIYPDNVWYTYHSQADIDRIINEHLVEGRVVQDLLMDSAVVPA